MDYLQQFPLRLKLRLMEAARRLRLKRSTGRLLEEFVDNPQSRHWSNDRLAASIGFHTRTIELALFELRAHGFISVQYRRKMTAIKRICVGAVLAAVEHGVEAAKKACAVGKSLLGRANSLIRNGLRPISHLGSNRASETAEWRVQRPASAALLRSMGLPVPPGRR